MTVSEEYLTNSISHWRCIFNIMSHDQTAGEAAQYLYEIKTGCNISARESPF
ncbi:hypothetical protein CLV42_1265 [Chitinophaga ginsengisoli]|uniref:Uncharacterized protein n=1 Tax=Chitinophaga ginsengisoli TaxID=363837 RepID=A0A2P8FDW0_9BACT|nr:hypothetical protein CLV42_1265 [Chitinophaga ginsengisoli]